jgi:hypothetical protein
MIIDYKIFIIKKVHIGWYKLIPNEIFPLQKYNYFPCHIVYKYYFVIVFFPFPSADYYIYYYYAWLLLLFEIDASF